MYLGFSCGRYLFVGEGEWLDGPPPQREHGSHTICIHYILFIECYGAKHLWSQKCMECILNFVGGGKIYCEEFQFTLTKLKSPHNINCIANP